MGHAGGLYTRHDLVVIPPEPPSFETHTSSPQPKTCWSRLLLVVEIQPSFAQSLIIIGSRWLGGLRPPALDSAPYYDELLRRGLFW
jgi:hypothetical protein